MNAGEGAEPPAAGGAPPPPASGRSQSPPRDARPRRTWRTYAALLGLAIAAAALAGLFRARAYVRNDPRFCSASCHVPKEGAGAWHTSGHQDLACQKCHVTAEGPSARLFVDKLMGSAKKPPPHAKVDTEGCVACHDKQPAEWRLVQDTEGHRAHRGVKDVDCLSCHGPTAHSTVSGEERVCLRCHQEQRVHKAAVGAETCLSCHSFAASAKLTQAPTREACETCHADPARMSASVLSKTFVPGKTIEPAVLHGRLDCKLCHDPHGKKHPVPKGQPVCARCHQMQIFIAGYEADQKPKGPAGHFDCEKCHKPHAPRRQALKSCEECHSAKVRGVITPAGGGPVSAATTALQHESCASCHLPHSWAAERSGCMQCHERQASGIQNDSPPQHSQCTNCHDVHGAPPSSQVCVGCHTQKKGHMGVAPGRHKDCTSCHNPHGANVQAAKNSCAGCHTNQLAGFAHGPDGHVKKGCVGCHTPHNNPKPDGALCGKCHDDKAKLVAAITAPPKHKNCASCHQSHQFSISDPMPACGKCHTSLAQNGLGPHEGACDKCHTLHGPPQVAKGKCFECHATIQAAFKPPNAQHDRCRSCHEPHRPAAGAAQKCLGCHDKPARAAPTWPSGSPHAGACNECHKPHDVRDKRACAECHKSEAESAKGGKHACIQCHKPHEPTPGKGAAWWGRCIGCHEAKVVSAKSRGPTHQDCQKCHKPHGFSVPGCQGCHADVQKKGVHAVKAHSDKCNACHDPHVKSNPTRKQCLACHTNKQNHEPSAESCYACHPFK